MGSTCTHVAYHINKEKYRFSYVRAMSRCYNLCSEKESGNDLWLMKSKLVAMRAIAPKQLKKRWFSSENGYYMMGVQHSIDVVDSILTRFVKGYSSEDEVFVRNILEGWKDEREVLPVEVGVRSPT
jgi:hypothetical protein